LHKHLNLEIREVSNTHTHSDTLAHSYFVATLKEFGCSITFGLDFVTAA